MKKHLSVFALFARSSIYKLLLILLAVSALETAAFTRVLNRSLDASAAISYSAGIQQLEGVFSDSGMALFLFCAFVAFSIVLALPGTELSSRSGYTLRRLSVSEAEVFFLQALFNLFAYILLYATHSALSLLLCRLYVNAAPDWLVGNQTVFLAYYRSGLLHALLPLSDITLWLRNSFLFIALSFAAALFPLRQRRKSFNTALPLCVIYTAVFFRQGIGNIANCAVTAVLMIAVSSYAIYFALKGDKADDN